MERKIGKGKETQIGGSAGQVGRADRPWKMLVPTPSLVDSVIKKSKGAIGYHQYQPEKQMIGIL